MKEGQEEPEEFEDIADEEEEIEGKDLFGTPVLDAVIKDPKRILNTKEKQKRFKNHKKIEDNFNQDKEKKEGEKEKVHPGFVSSYSFGENEFERLKLMLLRLDEAAERVMTFRKENLIYFPEFYAILNNFFICIYFIVDSTNRKKIKEGMAFIREAVIDYTTSNQKEINTVAIITLSEIYLLLSNIKNFHGLGFSYEKKRGDSEKFYDAFFKKKR